MLLTLSTRDKCFRVSHQNEDISRAGKKDVEALWGRHESYVANFVTASERSNNNFTLFSLEVIYFLRLDRLLFVPVLFFLLTNCRQLDLALRVGSPSLRQKACFDKIVGIDIV